MDNRRKEICADDILQMMDDSSKLLSEENGRVLNSVAVSYLQDNALAESVEFWKWMDQNYSSANGHMFSSNSAMRGYIAQGEGKEEWFYKQVQGKGYEWDWMQKQRHSIRNIFKKYDAGTVSNQPGYDVLERDFLSGTDTKYQMKAYIGKSNPDLHNTEQSIKVVTNSEKIEAVANKGYQVEEYKNNAQIKKKTDQRVETVKNGTATPKYGIRNVACTMGKAGFIGALAGVTTESVLSYKRWKSGAISDHEYITEILKSGGDAGITSAATAGIMIPITAVVTAAGIAAPVTIPITFLVSAAVSKIVAPCFGHGKYNEILNKARYYQSIEGAYNAFVSSAENASKQYVSYIAQMQQQTKQHEQMKQVSMNLNQELKNIYDAI
ncbi:hypothetical protein AALA98_13935 [Lachnospiraceae bacterium 45-W7]